MAVEQCRTESKHKWLQVGKSWFCCFPPATLLDFLVLHQVTNTCVLFLLWNLYTYPRDWYLGFTAVLYTTCKWVGLVAFVYCLGIFYYPWFQAFVVDCGGTLPWRTCCTLRYMFSCMLSKVHLYLCTLPTEILSFVDSVDFTFPRFKM